MSREQFHFEEKEREVNGLLAKKREEVRNAIDEDTRNKAVKEFSKLLTELKFANPALILDDFDLALSAEADVLSKNLQSKRTDQPPEAPETEETILKKKRKKFYGSRPN